MDAMECDATYSITPPQQAHILKLSRPIAFHLKRHQSNPSPPAGSSSDVRATRAVAVSISAPSAFPVPMVTEVEAPRTVSRHVTRPIAVSQPVPAVTAVKVVTRKTLSWPAAATQPSGGASRPPLSRTRKSSRVRASTSSFKTPTKSAHRTRRPRRAVRFVHRISKRERCPLFSRATGWKKDDWLTADPQRRRRVRDSGARARAADGALLDLLGLLLWSRHGHRFGRAMDKSQK